MASPASTSRLLRLFHVFVVGPLALWCGIAWLAPGSAQAAAVSASGIEGCVDFDALLLAAMTPADPSALISAAHERADGAAAQAGHDESDPFQHGMSCDGPSSCSPRLIVAEPAGPSRDGGEPVRGPMCSTSNPEACNLSSGSAPGQPQLDFGPSLVPLSSRRNAPLVRPEDDVLDSDAPSPGLRHAREQALCPRSIVRRLERPPRI